MSFLVGFTVLFSTLSPSDPAAGPILETLAGGGVILFLSLTYFLAGRFIPDRRP